MQINLNKPQASSWDSSCSSREVTETTSFISSCIKYPYRPYTKQTTRESVHDRHTRYIPSEKFTVISDFRHCLSLSYFLNSLITSHLHVPCYIHHIVRLSWTSDIVFGFSHQLKFFSRKISGTRRFCQFYLKIVYMYPAIILQIIFTNYIAQTFVYKLIVLLTFLSSVFLSQNNAEVRIHLSSERKLLKIHAFPKDNVQSFPQQPLRASSTFFSQNFPWGLPRSKTFCSRFSSGFSSRPLHESRDWRSRTGVADAKKFHR